MEVQWWHPLIWLAGGILGAGLGFLAIFGGYELYLRKTGKPF